MRNDNNNNDKFRDIEDAMSRMMRGSERLKGVDEDATVTSLSKKINSVADELKEVTGHQICFTFTAVTEEGVPVSYMVEGENGAAAAGCAFTAMSIYLGAVINNIKKGSKPGIRKESDLGSIRAIVLAALDCISYFLYAKDGEDGTQEALIYCGERLMAAGLGPEDKMFLSILRAAAAARFPAIMDGMSGGGDA